MTMIATLWCSCDDVETYAEMKEKEAACINNYIKAQGITVITKAEFEKDTITNIDNNEFVYFESNGVYMQIVNRGEGKLMEDGDRSEFLVRYLEENLQTGDAISNNFDSYDKLVCSREGISYKASFIEGSMQSIYGSSAVPSGWLIPFNYITPGRPNNKGAKVRLIVPHDQGTTTAAQYVHPAYYEITYISERL